MHAAVVTAFDRPPRFGEFREPTATTPDEEVVEVVATALHPRVRSQASGTHYESDGRLPLVPGIDGVGRRADGSLLYFVLPDTRLGSMAERVTIDRRRSIPIPDAGDPFAIAAAMNPAMSSWVALRRRARLEPGQSVLVLGATGSAGRLAVQVARQLGAARVIAAGRDAAALEELRAGGADAVASLLGEEREVDARLAEAAAEVDVVVDYLWGPPAERALPALLRAREDRGRTLTWVQVGAMAGPEIRLPSELLRQAAVALMGSGQGSVSTGGILEELVPLLAEVGAGTFALDTEVRPLKEVETVWDEPRSGRRRLVFGVG